MDQPWFEALCAAVDGPTMMAHLDVFGRYEKLSGTPAEAESFSYLRGVLEGYGYRTRLIRHEAYISLPGRGRLEIGETRPEVVVASFSTTTPSDGLRASLVYAGTGRAEDFANRDVRGRIVLLDGIMNPAATLRAGQAGALGQVHVSPHSHLHQMCVSSVWGSPGTDTLGSMPGTAVVSLSNAEGEALKARLAAGEAIDAVLHAEADTRWTTTPLLEAELAPDGAAADDPFVLFSGHHDTWFLGVMDNGAANATMLEAARLLAGERDRWRRSLRLCFWSGHSHGRYSGSAWYADAHWAELEARCVAHVNVDSTGGRGATVLADAPASHELMELARSAVRLEGGQEIDGLRMARAGDQSFWGIGIPSLFMGMSEQPPEAGVDVARSVLSAGVPKKGAGFGWWWHTPDDTLDKIDPAVLARDTRIYVHALGRLLGDDILPLDIGAQASALAALVAPMAAALGPVLDFAPLTGALRELRTAAADLEGRDAASVNAALLRACRALVPIDYTRGDRFVHDPALGALPYPSLDPVRRLLATPPGSDAARFACVDARRALNRVTHAVREAERALAARRAA